MDAPPQTLMVAGASPPAGPEGMSITRAPVLLNASLKVSGHGVPGPNGNGHWSPLDRMVPNVVPPSGMSLKQLLGPMTPQSKLSGIPSKSVSRLSGVTVNMKFVAAEVIPVGSAPVTVMM